MKKVCAVLFASLTLVSFSSVAAEDISNKLIIQAVPLSEGTVVNEGKPKYEKTFDIVVNSLSEKPIKLTGRAGCYKAFDEKGKEFDLRTVYLDLYGTLEQGGAKIGKVSFVSDDDSVYNAKFVKWSLQCPNLAKAR